MSRGTRFTEEQLRERGFNPSANGSWSQGNLFSDDSKPSTSKHQQHECSEPLESQEDQGQGEKSLRYRLIITSYRTQLIDPSNASIKQIEDCLTPPQGKKKYGIGIIPDDSPKFCDQPLFLQYKVKKEEERTEITVLKYKL